MKASASLFCLALAACAGTPPALVQRDSPLLPDPALHSDDRLTVAAALLVAAENAPGEEARLPLLARLDALGVAAQDGLTDDPLARWRAEADQSRLVPYRGRTLGPAYRRMILPSGQSTDIEQVFYAGKKAVMVARSTGGQPVALAVENAQAGTVCETQLMPGGRCNWLPIFTERYTIRLENRGTRDASIYLVFE